MTKTFTVGAEVPTTKTPNSFEVEITTMRGDADGYETFIAGPFMKDSDEEGLTSLVETLDRMAVEFPNGRGGYSMEYWYHHVEGVTAWFGEVVASSEEEYLEGHKFALETYPEYRLAPYEMYAKHIKFVVDLDMYLDWPYDMECDTQQSFNKCEVFYYDETLAKHFVTVLTPSS